MRVRCRNLRCRSKLPVPTENDHKAFCSPHCHAQFFHWKCAVCETPIPRGRHSKPRKCCRDRKCRSAYRRFHETYSPPEKPSGGHREPIREADVKNPCGTGSFFGEKGVRGWRWEASGDKHCLFLHDRHVATVSGAEGDWKITRPRTIPVQGASTLEAARKKAVEAALWTLPLDPATAKHIARTNRQYRESVTGRDPAPEANDDYSAIVAMLDADNRVIRCVDDVQWIVQKREGRIWNGVYFCRTKEALLRYAVSAELLALPEDAAPKTGTAPINILGGHKFTDAPRLDPDLRREIIASERLDWPPDESAS